MRRKSKPIPKSTHNDDKKVGEICKKAGLQEIQAMDEANIIMNDGSVVQFTGPKVRGSMPANSFVLFGTSSQTTISKLSAEMRGEGAGARSAGAGGAPQLPPQLENALKKFQTAMEKAGISQNDMQDPAKQSKVQAALANAGLTEEENATLQALMGQMGGAEAGESEDMPG